MLLVIDNYDSFTWNLVQLIQTAEADVEVVRNDAIDRPALERMAHDGRRPLRGILVSPGPSDPEHAGISLEAIAFAAERRLPLLGVCLGMQALGAAFGGNVVRAPAPVHGAASDVWHDGRGVFEGLPSPMPAGRYHSLCVERTTLPPVLDATATSDDGVVMGLRHRRLPLEGVQFHPESVLTPDGPRIVAAFLRRAGEGEPERLAGRDRFAFRGLAA